MKRFPNNRGFTLMELLVAMSIFSLLTTFVVAKFSFSERSRSLKLEASKILFALQKTENMAITGQIFDSFIPLVYEFSLADCSEDCFYLLGAKDASGDYRELERQELKGLSVDVKGTDRVLFRFLPPRGFLEIIVGEQEGQSQQSAEATIGDNDISYCLEAGAVSGRINLKNGACQ